MSEEKMLCCAVRCVRSWESLWRSYCDYDKGTFAKTNDDSEHWIFRGDKKSKERYEKDPESKCKDCGKSIPQCLCDEKDFQIPIGGTDIQTHLEQAFESFRADKRYKRIDIEKALIRSFQRKAGLYIEHPPDLDDVLEWLSLMRHHGAPTRLVDWSYSFFNAVYFAVNQLNCDDEIAEVWVLNARWFSTKTDKEILGIRKDYSELLEKEKEGTTDYKGELSKNRSKIVSLLMDEPDPIHLIYNVTPFRENRRLTAQQGTFLLAGDITVSFLENLRIYMDYCGFANSISKVVISVCPDQRNEILRQLHRMNINQATLFPDLDGFAKSLWCKLAYPEIFGLDIQVR